MFRADWANSWCTIFCNILIVKYVNKEHQENVIFVINILWENVRRTQICYKYDPNKNVIRLYTVEHENCHVTDPFHDDDYPRNVGISIVQYTATIL